MLGLFQFVLEETPEPCATSKESCGAASWALSGRGNQGQHF